MIEACKICRYESGHQELTVTEKMLGLGDPFRYFRCARCGCLQLASPPQDWNRYYPSDYYSFNLPPPPQRGLKAWLAGWRDRGVLTGNRGPGDWLARWIPTDRPDVHSLGRLSLRRDMSILEVGCGRGQLLAILYRAGFRHLAGVDPYLPEDVEVLPNLWVRRLALEEVSESYDLIMMHHVFEHLPQPRASLSACAKRLKASGKILLRLPTVESVAWERYRENWVQWDAPRHHFLHTRASLEILARQSGLVMEACWCDSTAFQFWGSELYQRGYKLADSAGRPWDPRQLFSSEELEKFERQSRELNAENRGDQMVVILSRAAP